MGLLNQIIRRLQRNPFRVVIVDDFRKWRGITLYAAALILARRLEKSTGRPHIGIMLPSSGAFAMALLAIWLLRRMPVPLNFLLKPDELAFVIEDAELDFVITAREMVRRFGDLPDGVQPLFIEEVSFRRLPYPRRTPRQQPGDPGALIYTSGTAGPPKGVWLTAGNLGANVDQSAEWGELRRDDVLLGVLPQFHSFGLTVLTLLPLARGLKVVYAAQFVPRRLRALARTHRPTGFIGVPAMFAAMLREREAGTDDYNSFRMMVAGGEPLDGRLREAFEERFGVRVQEGYGLTETGPVLNWLRPQDDRPGSVGRPLPRIEQRVVDEDNRPLGPGETGEICVRGPNVMREYFKRPSETVAAFDDQGFFHTGDLGYIDADGYLFITGRRSDLIIVGGENVFPREIEDVLNAHPAVADSGVVGASHASRGQVPIAFVQLEEGASVEARELRAYCRGQLARYKVPREIRIVEELPRGPTGKVSRRQLSAIYAESPTEDRELD